MGVCLWNNHKVRTCFGVVLKNLDISLFGGIFKSIGYLLQYDVNVLQPLKDPRLFRDSIEKLQRTLSSKVLGAHFLKAPETFRARKTNFSSSVSKNREV